uniref:Uncharacterized protein n=1 Tax=Romanomermis culicivorax TaxID=13658 RepID=A0A915IHJ3_ROMCU
MKDTARVYEQKKMARKFKHEPQAPPCWHPLSQLQQSLCNHHIELAYNLLCRKSMVDRRNNCHCFLVIEAETEEKPPTP